MQGQGAGGTAFWAHIGGFAAGIALGLVFAGPIRRAQRWAMPPGWN